MKENCHAPRGSTTTYGTVMNRADVIRAAEDSSIKQPIRSTVSLDNPPMEA
jgi:hypothetical protein